MLHKAYEHCIETKTIIAAEIGRSVKDTKEIIRAGIAAISIEKTHTNILRSIFLLSYPKSMKTKIVTVYFRTNRDNNRMCGHKDYPDEFQVSVPHRVFFVLSVL